MWAAEMNPPACLDNVLTLYSNSGRSSRLLQTTRRIYVENIVIVHNFSNTFLTLII